MPDLHLAARSGADDAFVDGSVTFIGTATVLLRCGGFTVLTDPNFLHQGDHAPLGWGLRSARLTNPAMELDELPEIDFVLLSHHHGDHFDPVVVRTLDKDTPIVTEPHSAAKLTRQGFRRTLPLATWESLRVVRGDRWINITATPGKHAPTLLQPLLPRVMGSVLDIGEGATTHLRVHVTGDTLYHDRLAEIPHRFPDIDLCIIHLGGTRIAGVLLTMDADQGVRALRLLRPAVAIPVHTDDYTVFHSSLADFRRAVAEATDLTAIVHELARGETYSFPLTRGAA
jgi:L-ascorbate metabolism protein UlaG (beta-lactamase superfamily)